MNKLKIIASLVAVIAILAVGWVYLANPPSKVYFTKGAFVKVGSQMRIQYPQGLPLNVSFDKVLKSDIPVKNGGKAKEYEMSLPSYFPKSNYYIENSQETYSSNGQRVVCWTQIETPINIFYVMLFANWESKWTNELASKPKMYPRANR